MFFYLQSYWLLQCSTFWSAKKNLNCTPLVLKSLHWLPVCPRIDFKVLLLFYNCLNGLGPSNFSELLLPNEHLWTLRSCGSCLLIIPNKTKPIVWHLSRFTAYICGPACQRTCGSSMDGFKRRLKTHLFIQAFNLSFLFFLLLTYLLTYGF